MAGLDHGAMNVAFRNTAPDQSRVCEMSSVCPPQSFGTAAANMPDTVGTTHRSPQRHKAAKQFSIIREWVFDNYEPSSGGIQLRSAMYEHYGAFCADKGIVPLNSANFGKTIHIIFPDIKTCRLGSRTMSKYHYKGLRAKHTQSSPDYKDYGNSYWDVPSIKSSYCPSEFDEFSNEGNDDVITYSYNSNPKVKTLPSDYVNQNAQLTLGIPTTILEQDGLIKSVNSAKLFQFFQHYHDYCEVLYSYNTIAKYNKYSLSFLKILSSLISLNFEQALELFNQTWIVPENRETSPGTGLLCPELEILCSASFVLDFVNKKDLDLYETILVALLPDLLENVPDDFLDKYKNFVDCLDKSMRRFESTVAKKLVSNKKNTLSAFVQLSRRRIALCRIGKMARKILECPQRLSKMQSSTNRINFPDIQTEFWLMSSAELSTVSDIERILKLGLQTFSTLEEWAIRLRDMVNTLSWKCNGQLKSKFTETSYQLVLEWSFYSSRIVRQMIMHGDVDVASFDIMMMFSDEYLYHLVQDQIARTDSSSVLAILSSQTPDSVREMYKGSWMDSVHQDVNFSPMDNSSCDAVVESSPATQLPPMADTIALAMPTSETKVIHYTPSGRITSSSPII